MVAKQLQSAYDSPSVCQSIANYEKGPLSQTTDLLLPGRKLLESKAASHREVRQREVLTRLTGSSVNNVESNKGQCVLSLNRIARLM